MIDVQQDPTGIVTCWIDNPRRHNALNDTMLAALSSAMETAAEQGARAMLVRGRSGVFCAGRDLGELDAQDDESRDALALRIAPALRLARAVRACGVPTVAVIEGKAVGLGVALASWCDMALANDAAGFSIPEARVGIAPSFTVVSLMETIGRRAALSLCLTGRTVGAAEALTLGLVQQVCAVSDTEEALQALAGTFIKGSPRALRMTKLLLDGVGGKSFDAAMVLASEAAVASMQTQDAVDGMMAFRAKRPPAWVTAGQGR